MGWNWALACCQGVLRNSIQLSGVVEERAIADGKPAVVVTAEGPAAVAGYVDKYGAVAGSRQVANRAANAITKQLESMGLAVHELESAGGAREFLGLYFLSRNVLKTR